jgi:small subunit ribosomal protein S36
VTDTPLVGSTWLRRDLRDAPRAVWYAVALHLLLLVVYTTLQPTYRGLDEVAHVAMVLTVPSPLDWPAPGAKLVDDRVRDTFGDAGWDGIPTRRLAAGDALPKADRKTFLEAGATDLPIEANQMVQHPPLYYLVTRGVLDAIPHSENWPFDRQVALMRFLSLLFVVPLPLLCWLAARRLNLPPPAGVVAAFAPLAVPGLTRVASSVSNDSLLILAVAAAGVLSMAVAAGDLRRRTSVALGVVSAVAMLTKGLALVLPVVVVAAYAAAAFRALRPRTVLLPASVATLLTVGLAGGWYVQNVRRFGSVQPNGYDGGVLPYPRRPGGGLAEWLPGYVNQMFFRFWSALGQPEPPQLPHALCEALSLAVVALAVLALATARGRRLRVVVALLPLAGVLLLVAGASYRNYQTYDRFVGVQGRYLYPAVAGLAAVVALGLSRLAGRWGGGLPVVVLAGAGVMQLLGMHAMLVTYWTPPDAPENLVSGLGSLQAWSPLPARMVQILWVLTLAVALLTAAGTVRMVRRLRPGRAPRILPLDPTADREFAA